MNYKQTSILLAFLDKLYKKDLLSLNKGRYIQLGDWVKLNFSGEGVVYNYTELSEEIDLVKEKKAEIRRLKQEIQRKDELIVVLKETIALLKKEK